MSMSTLVPRTLLLFEAGAGVEMKVVLKMLRFSQSLFLCDGARERQDNRKKTTFAFQVK